MTSEQWDRVWSLCKAASSLPPSEAAAFLETSNEDPEVVREAALTLAAREAELAEAIEDDRPEWPQLGKQIGRFEVLEPIGRGGAGEVYKGRDPVLGRTVALKFIAHDAAHDSSAPRRFIREAQAASTLNHPNIVTVYEVVSVDSLLAIAMEFVEGVPLRKLFGVPLPWEKVVAYGLQMSQALAAAHSHNLVHRDVKPENVIVRPDGYIKVLDFGLARNFSPGSRSVTSKLGLPVGTIRYMSPEQCRGETATPASDVFSLGITLYEACTGKHPFDADSPLDVAHNIVWENPRPPGLIQPAIPPALSTLLLQMLAKEPAARLSSADVAQKLTAIGEPVHPRRNDRRWLYAAVATIAAAGLAVWVSLGNRTTNEPRLQLLRSFPLTSQQGYETYPAISPDGTAVAFTLAERVGESSQIWVKRLGEPSAVRLSSAVDGLVGSPTWSADGQRIFFKRSSPTGLGGIMSVASAGGNETKVADLLVGDPSSALDSSPDGRWLAFSDKPGPNSAHAVMMVDLQTGQRRQVTGPPDGYWGDWDPKFSPDGRMLAFKRVKGLWQDSLYLVPVSGGVPRQLTFDGQGIAGHAWLQGGGSLLAACQRGGTIYGLWRVPVEPAGQPVLISSGGADLIAPATARSAATIAWVNQVSDENIYRIATSGDSAPVRFIASTRRDTRPKWAPDGRIAFISDRAGSLEIWLAQPDGSGQTQVTNFRRGPTGTPHWSADGRRLVTNAYSDGRVVTLDCEPPGLTCGKPGLVPRVLPVEYEPAFSGDGNFIYFSDNQGIWNEPEGIWRQPAAGGQPVQITRRGGQLQQESRDGRWLYYCKRLSGIWRTRLPVPGTGADDEEKLVDLPAEYVPVWALGTTEIFFFKGKAASEPAGIFAYNIPTRKIRRITSTSEVRSIAVSHDQRQLLYSQLDHSGSNIFVANAGDNSPNEPAR
jgi:eukaryotic-like serine/threonine-protein kinase